MKILLTGEGGQGIQTMAKIISEAAYQARFNVVYIPHYGVEMRMGISRAFIIISPHEISYPKFLKADILLAMTKREIGSLKEFIDRDTNVINASEFDKITSARSLPSSSLNMVALGIIVKILNNKNIRIDKKLVIESIKNHLKNKPDILGNCTAFEQGYDLNEELYNKPIDSIRNVGFKPAINKDSKKEHTIFPDICKGCGLCLIKCPVNALGWDTKLKNYISKPIPAVDIEKCISCGICQDICPECAIIVNKK